MTAAPVGDSLRQHLFAEEGQRVYAVLDGASVAELVPQLQQHTPEHVCLRMGELDPELLRAAPYLVALDPAGEFTRWVVEEGWGQHWGIFAASSAGLRPLRQHFRRFLKVHDATGKPLLFRYYDPRVLRSYLPMCNAKELGGLFGPVTTYFAEGENPGQLLRFRAAGGALVADKFALEADERL
jgi:hypothetical protein